jgi:hypothetical protein
MMLNVSTAWKVSAHRRVKRLTLARQPGLERRNHG